MDLWRLPSNENTVQFNDRKCVYHSRSYYCQPIKAKPKPRPPPPPPAPRRIHPVSQLKAGLKEEIFPGLKNLKKVPNLNALTPRMDQVVSTVNYPNTKGAWPRHPAENFAARFSGFLQISQKGTYRLSLSSDDGSKLYIGNSLVVDNDGLHGMRKREATRMLRAKSYRIILEYIEKGGHAGLTFKYMGPDTQNRMVIVPKNKLRPLYGKTRTPMPRPKARAKAKGKAKGKAKL